MNNRNEEPRVLPPQTEGDESARDYGRQLAMDGLLHTLLDEDVRAGARTSGRASRRTRRSSVVVAAERPLGFWTLTRLVSAAAVVLLLTSAVLLWVSTRNEMGPAPVHTVSSEEHRRSLQQEVETWDEALAVVQTQEPAPEPDAAKDLPPTDAPNEETALLPTKVEDASETARLIEARRDFVLEQLRHYDVRPPHVQRGEDEEAPGSASTTREHAPDALAEEREVGQVLTADDVGAQGLLVRETSAGEQRVPLARGLKIRMGDRIETSAKSDNARASVALKGGATLSLDRNTVLKVLGSDALRLQSGRIYAHITVPQEAGYRDSAPPFALEAQDCRFLAQDARAEIFIAPEMSPPQSGAKVDQGKVHLVNRKGHVVGTKGQEIRAAKDASPTRSEGFSGAIWRGVDRMREALPVGPLCPVILSSSKPSRTIASCYALALAHRGELRLVGVQTAMGEPHQEALFKQCGRDALALQQAGIRAIPPLALGALQPLRLPPSGKLEDIRPEQTAAVLQIQACAQNASTEVPLVFLCGGVATDLASAWLIDRSLAERVVLVVPFGTRADSWWKQDTWAAEIVLRYFRCVFVGGPILSVGQKQLDRLTDPRWASLLKRERDIGNDEDFRLVAFLNAEPGKKVGRLRFVGFQHDRPAYETDPEGRIWRVWNTPDLDCQSEFNRIFLSPPVR